MHTYFNNQQKWVPAWAALFLLLWSTAAGAAIQGRIGTAFTLRAKSGIISTADGSSLTFWGYDDGGGNGVQYPGPTLIVNQNVPITVTLINELSEPSSIVFPGQVVTASGGSAGLLTNEAPPDRLTAVTYTFTPSEPGTYTYYSGTHSDLQIEMGLVGALIVRPTANPATTAYGDARSQYDREYLFLISEMDPVIHDQVEFNRMNQVNTAAFWPVLWFINGRNGPDTLAANCDTTLPTQPYNIVPQMKPGERLLARFVGAGRDLHPFHLHGNNFDQIARDGRLLESAAGAARNAEAGTVPDLAVSDFTLTVAPGATYDVIFTWSGKELGWDFYGHAALSDVATLAEIIEQTTLNGAITTGATTGVSVDSDAGFPATHQFRAVISAAADQNLDQVSDREVVLVTRTGANTFTLTRAQESSTAYAWPDGSYLSLTDHGLPFPVTLPGTDVIATGGFYSGSPYLGAAGFLPPGEGGNNAYSGFYYMWHSHNEKEIINNDIFPGGMLTMMIVNPPDVAEPMDGVNGGVCP